MIEKVVQAKKGDKEALREIIVSFTPFVIKTARGIYVKGCDEDDLIQIGRMSIMKAVSMFDVSKGKGFISYVTNSVTKLLLFNKGDCQRDKLLQS